MDNQGLVEHSPEFQAPSRSSFSQAIKHFMPLSNGASPLEGPNHSAFSTPKFIYSPQTNQLLGDLMRESRLTFTQRSGLQAILRQGDPLPPRPGDVYRQEVARGRHAARAKMFGIPVLPPEDGSKSKSRTAQLYANKFGSGGRRSFESIQKVCFQSNGQAQGRRVYIPVDKEKEKERFAHLMETGKALPDPLQIQQLRQKEKENPEDSEHSAEPEPRFMELVQEIGDRLAFLEQTESFRRRREKQNPYQGVIRGQIQALVQEMRSISEEQTMEVVGRLFGPEFETEYLTRHTVKQGPIAELLYPNYN